MKFSNDTATLLTETAFSIAMKLLQDTGNQPHEHQRKALFAILDAMTGMAQGSLKGRWAFGLQTGLGKTTCAMSWAAALHKRELAGDVSMVIAAQDVESLCETFDALKGLGVDKDQVGLLHRKPSARYPATPNAVDKPILLLCHARVKEKFLEQFKYRGEMRDLLIYDESLITTSSSTCAATTLYEIAGALAGRCHRNEDDREEFGELSEWLTHVSDAVAGELTRLKEISSTQSVLLLPQRPQETLDRFTELTKSLKNNETILNLIQLCQSPVKVSNFADKGVLGFQVTVPSALKNIIILDASNPIRDLVRYDRSVLDAEEHLPKVKAVGVPLASLKRYDGTTIYQMKAGGGRGSMTKSFKQIHSHQRRICKEVIEVLTRIPKDESTLIIAFKPVYEQTGPVSFVKILEDDINASGVVTMKHQDSVELVEGTEKPRVSITTWGLHKGTNKYKHCTNLIMVGIIHRDMLDLFGVSLDKEDISKEQTWQRLKDLQLSEVAHDCFQAIGRIRCRTVVNGVALPVNVWLIHASSNLREKLDPVLQGAVWKKWETKYDEIPEGKEQGTIKQTAQALDRYLTGCGLQQVPVKSLRRVVPECGRLAPRTMTEVVNLALELNRYWLRHGHNLVRIGFEAEAV